MLAGAEVVEYTRTILAKCVIFTVLTILFTNWTYDFFLVNTKEKQEKSTFPSRDFFEEIDRDWEVVYSDSVENRSGLGDMGKPASLEEEHLRLYEYFGYDAMLSDYIPLDRVLADVRDPECRNKPYLAKLPTTSVIITFYNEHLSVLLRTVYSILQRTPDELLNEILLVDDCSALNNLGNSLEEHVQRYMPQKVRLLRVGPQRLGLMAARMAGARMVTNRSKVLVFLDSHFEVMYNWLPPLLEPIVLNPKACTCPLTDTIHFKTFEYSLNARSRGYFNWKLEYYQFLLREEDLRNSVQPYYDYVMLGGAMAIAADFFWQLGGFDDGMEYWGGEQYEMSFKLWMCGGELLKVPCSRMGHIYRDPDTGGNKNLYGGYDFVKKNIRRLIEVWMDPEYRQYIFERMPEVRLVDPGSLAERHAIRAKLQCKSFSWLMETIFFEVSQKFPPIEPADFGYGVLESLGAPGLCIDNMGGNQRVGLYPCAENKTHPQFSQLYHYTWRLELRNVADTCLESDYSRNLVTDWFCHFAEGNQRWFYNRSTKWIVQDNLYCMVANANDNKIHLRVCDPNDVMMRWEIGFLNDTRIIDMEERVMRVSKKQDF